MKKYIPEMKKYILENMVKISRYQNFFPTLSEDIRSDIYTRMKKLIHEEEGYCDQGNYEHMSQILTSRYGYDFAKMMTQNFERITLNDIDAICYACCH